MASTVFAYVIVSLLAFVPLFWFALGPLLWRGVGTALGWVLRRKTDGRRAQILQVMNDDEEAYQANNKDKKESGSEDDEWEAVSAHALGTAQNGDKGEKDWEGIVGFFHPFW